jgi:hypothetical protein
MYKTYLNLGTPAMRIMRLVDTGVYKMKKRKLSDCFDLDYWRTCFEF